MIPRLVLCAVLLLSSAGVARAQQGDAAPPVAPPATERSRPAWGLNLDLGFATAFVFRGVNVFQQEGQMDQNMLLAPGVTWQVFDTGLSVGYWGAFQISGDNISANIDGGVGAEQDLFVTYEYAITEAIGVSGGLTGYFYPAADKEVTGASVPSFLEPSLGGSYSTVVDLGLKLAYLLGIQDQPGIRGYSYFYINPTVGKSFTLTDWLGLDLSFGYGFKVFKEGNDGASNVHDLLLGLAAPITALKWLYVKPSVNLAWTNIEDDVTAGGAVDEKGFSDGLVFWAGLNVGTDI